MSYADNRKLWLADVDDYTYVATGRVAVRGPRCREFMQAAPARGSTLTMDAKVQDLVKGLSLAETAKQLDEVISLVGYPPPTFVGNDIPDSSGPSWRRVMTYGPWAKCLADAGRADTIAGLKWNAVRMYCMLADWVAAQRTVEMRCFALAFRAPYLEGRSLSLRCHFSFESALTTPVQFQLTVPTTSEVSALAQELANYPGQVWEVIPSGDGFSMECGQVRFAVPSIIATQLQVPPQAVAASMPNPTLYSPQAGEYRLSSTVSGELYRLVSVWGRLLPVLSSQHPSTGFLRSPSGSWVCAEPIIGVRTAPCVDVVQF